MAGPTRFWEDYELGAVYEIGSKLMTKEEIVEFASKYDPQPFHLDEDARRRSIFGGLAASGWHTCSSVMRLLVDNYISRETSLGSPGVDEVRWLKPVLAADTVTAKVRIVDKKPSRSRPEMGSIFNQYEVYNQAGALVMTMKGVGLIRRRPAG